MDLKTSNAFATGLYQGVQIVTNYMKERSALIENVLPRQETKHRDSCLLGLWLRARAWMQSLEKLNHTQHVQAISTANRALLEITVDMLLLYSDKTNVSGWKMFQWAQSEKMKAAESVVSFYDGLGLPVPDRYEPLALSYKNEKAIVDDMRRNLWPDKKDPSKAVHPGRWTGNSNLFDDIKKADELYGSVVQEDIGVTLVEYYRTEYRRMNWLIHSGVAGVMGLPVETFTLISSAALYWCANFAMLCTKIILTDFEFSWVLTNMKEEWKKVRHHRALAFHEAKQNSEFS